MGIYTDIESVQRILRTSADGRIRMSSQALERVQTYRLTGSRATPEPLNTISVAYRDILVSDDFVGKYRLKFNFEDATSFQAYEVDETMQQELPVGSGTIGATFTTPDGLITVPAATFGGSPAEGDIVEISFTCHISSSDIDFYIADAEIEIDSVLSEFYAGYVGTGETRVFPTSVPLAIQVAAQYLAAYYIYTDIFRSKFKEEDAFKLNYSNRWKTRAEKMMQRFAETDRRSIPRVISFPSPVDKLGLTSVGPGATTIGRTVSDIQADVESEDIFEPGGIDEEV